MASRRGGKIVCEHCSSIDVREWHRADRLTARQSFTASWSFGGKPLGSINVVTKRNAVVLAFQYRQPSGADWTLIEQEVPISWTACAMGGQRPWFRCSMVSNNIACGRRVAKLYLADRPTFACRQCLKLAYDSQSKGQKLRGIGKARKIRERLGGSLNLCEPFPAKPKGLHHHTYQKLRVICESALS